MNNISNYPKELTKYKGSSVFYISKVAIYKKNSVAQDTLITTYKENRYLIYKIESI